jgi:hypothetical protein
MAAFDKIYWMSNFIANSRRDPIVSPVNGGTAATRLLPVSPTADPGFILGATQVRLSDMWELRVF